MIISDNARKGNIRSVISDSCTVDDIDLFALVGGDGTLRVLLSNTTTTSTSSVVVTVKQSVLVNDSTVLVVRKGNTSSSSRPPMLSISTISIRAAYVTRRKDPPIVVMFDKHEKIKSLKRFLIENSNNSRRLGLKHLGEGTDPTTNTSSSANADLVDEYKLRASDVWENPDRIIM